mmetsp:Transcript_41653/g.87207  ORF Transcript_41653/g.87207 Transcript_41653/m.87207 type:complete len:244 (+) Transcript_41653:64-795(+)
MNVYILAVYLVSANRCVFAFAPVSIAQLHPARCSLITPSSPTHSCVSSVCSAATSINGARVSCLESRRRAAVSEVSMIFQLFSSKKQIRFNSKVDASRLVRATKKMITSVQRWREPEWRQFGLLPLKFTATDTPAGIQLTYYRNPQSTAVSSLSALEEDGGMMIRIDLRDSSASLLFEPLPQSLRWKRHEDAMFARLLIAIKQEKLLAEALAPGQEPSNSLAEKISKIDSACMYDKVVTKKYK